MQANEVRMLWLYAKELWGTTFQLPEDEVTADVKEAVWLDALGDFDAGLLRRAMVSSAAHFSPTPLELRELAFKRLRIESGAGERPSADKAIGELMRLIRQHGWVHPDRAREEVNAFDSALVEFVTRWEGSWEKGWQQLCQELPDEPGSTFRAQFRDSYNAAGAFLDTGQAVSAPLLAEYGRTQRAIRDRQPDELELSEEA